MMLNRVAVPQKARGSELSAPFSAWMFLGEFISGRHIENVGIPSSLTFPAGETMMRFLAATFLGGVDYVGQ
jgi:hypothetical protein